jgi:hypothetical protein
MALFHGYYGYRAPPPRKTYLVLVLAVALVVLPWSLIGWLIWTLA